MESLLATPEFQMCLLLFVALGGYLVASRINQSAVIGLILVGLLVGPSALGLITYSTSGEPETRAWTIKNGFTAPQAAGVIHTDFERGFIAADVIPWDKLVEAGGWSEARAKGWVRTEGKTYIFRDGDTTLFKFNV